MTSCGCIWINIDYWGWSTSWNPLFNIGTPEWTTPQPPGYQDVYFQTMMMIWAGPWHRFILRDANLSKPVNCQIVLLSCASMSHTSSGIQQKAHTPELRPYLPLWTNHVHTCDLQILRICRNQYVGINMEVSWNEATPKSCMFCLDFHGFSIK